MIYSVGVMVVIFLLLTGITFNRRMDVRKSDDYLNKRTECLKISNTVSSLSASGDGTQRTIQIIYHVPISNQSRITVSETAATPKTVEAVCTYTGSTAGAGIAGIGLYRFTNTQGVVYITKAS